MLIVSFHVSRKHQKKILVLFSEGIIEKQGKIENNRKWNYKWQNICCKITTKSIILWCWKLKNPGNGGHGKISHFSWTLTLFCANQKNCMKYFTLTKTYGQSMPPTNESLSFYSELKWKKVQSEQIVTQINCAQ